MERIEHYRQCIQKLLVEQTRGKLINEDIEVQTLFDTEREHYQVVHLGWDGHQRIYNCLIHLDIKNSKIWIQRNQTDTKIADELVEMGVPKEDIVLGLQPVYVREYTGFDVK